MQASKQLDRNLDCRQIGAALAAVEATGSGCITPGLGYRPVDRRNIPLLRAFLKYAFNENVGVRAIATRLLI